MTTVFPDAGRAPSLSVRGMSKAFGAFKAIDDVSLELAAGEFHALLGENGAGKSTLVKCIMGFHAPDSGTMSVDGAAAAVRNPRDAQALGIGMVYQHFTLVPSLSAAENLVISRRDAPAVIDWARERAALESFLARMPFRVPLDVPVGVLSAGERQKLEILKLLYLDQRILILDEPTSVLTPREADEVLGLLREMSRRGEISVLMISHKFREVMAFCDAATVLRRGVRAGGGRVGELGPPQMARLMMGDAPVREPAERVAWPEAPVALQAVALFAHDESGVPLLDGLDLKVRAGEVLGLAGVSGNGQAALMEALTGQRALSDGRVFVHGQPFEPKRRDFDRFGIHGLPEEPLKNALAPRMSVAENLAFRNFDRRPLACWGWWLSPARIRRQGEELIARYKVKTSSPDAAMETLSGGNVQRAVLARELSGEVRVLIVANPCFGLDFVSAADIRAQIIDQRNRGVAVLLISEDLDEILDLADRVAVMSAGRVAYEAPRAEVDRVTIGAHMAAHRSARMQARGAAGAAL
jgi:ABC-type uncharacterized transport system ATPase subunit